MPISPYIRELRARVGSTRLLLPSVSAHIFDAGNRLLLVRQSDGDVWSTPGGLIEPDEQPADAAVREAWEETGLIVKPERLVGSYGGPHCVVRYPNGDETQYVVTAFRCSIVGGTLRPDGDETTATGYYSEEEAVKLHLAAWLRAHLALVFGEAAGMTHHAAAWSPPITIRPTA